MKIAYFDCFSGISGDMALGALLDAGLDIRLLSRELKKLHINGYLLKKGKARRGEIVGTKFDCVATKVYAGHRSLKSILSMIDKSALKPGVKSTAKDIFNTIGRAEAKIHGYGKNDAVYLHELGNIDSIVDIVGIAIGLDALDIDAVYSSAINMGRTFVRTAHGALPIPGPAALEILRGAPIKILDVEAELVTPTGAGIIKTLVRSFGEMPMVTVTAVGYGAGKKILKDIPNMLRVIIGHTEQASNKDKVLVVETNIDDMNPQYFGYVFEKLFEAGALDAYSTAIHMKKSRHAIKLTVLCRAEDLKKMSSVLFRETTTIGIRFYEAGRYTLQRKMMKVKTVYGDISVKISTGQDGVSTVTPEYDDCVRIARRKNVPLRVVSDKVREMAHEVS